MHVVVLCNALAKDLRPGCAICQSGGVKDECVRGFLQISRVVEDVFFFNFMIEIEIALTSDHARRYLLSMPRAVPNYAKLNLWAKKMRTTTAGGRACGRPG